jgi:DNA-binding NtrC family response regulator
MPARRYGSVPDDVPWIPAARARRLSLVPGGRAHALLVADDPMLGFSLVGVLEGRFAVELARDATRALQVLATDSFDVVVADEALPGRRGVDFLADVRDRHPRVRRVLMTADEELARAARGVCHHVLLKPFELEELLEALDATPAVAAAG